MRATLESVKPDAGQSFKLMKFSLPGFNAPYHFHPEYELTLIVQSDGTRFVGDSVEPFTQGDLVLIGSDVPHFWRSDSPSGESDYAVSVVAQFHHDAFGQGFFDRPEMRAVAELLSKSRRGIVFGDEARQVYGQRFHDLLESDPFGRMMGLVSILGELAATNDWNYLASDGYDIRLNNTQVERIDRVMNYLSEHVGEGISQPDVAALLHMTPAAFSRFFRKSTGQTFIGFLNHLRIARACTHLRETDWPITEIAFRCGFDNLSNFNRRFKALRGQSPKHYRNNFEI